MKFAVLGAGSWGTALARLLAHRGHVVSLWVYEADLAERIRNTGENDRYLPGIALPKSLQVLSDMAAVLSGVEAVLFAVPSHAARGVLAQAAPFLSPDVPVISATKGIERITLRLPSEIVREVLRREDDRHIAVLSGPSFAQEVAMEYPTTVILASGNPRLAARLRRAFVTPFFKPFISTDMVGVQLGGALKNVIALCVGISDGLGFSVNTKAALMTWGLAEMARLGAAMGADFDTFYGLSGMGDLFLTCTGGLSRNRKLGEAIGRGISLAEALAATVSVAEGVYTTQSAVVLAQRYHVAMPIVTETDRVLFSGKAPRQALSDLLAMARGKEAHAARNVPD